MAFAAFLVACSLSLMMTSFPCHATDEATSEANEEETTGADGVVGPTPAVIGVTPGFTLPGGFTFPPGGFVWPVKTTFKPQSAAVVQFSDTVFQMSRYWHLVVLPLSLVMNLLSMLVYLQPRRRRQSVSMVMSALAVADILALYQNWVKMIDNETEFNLTVHSPFFCKSIAYVSYVGRSLSSWYIVLFTAERLISVKFPLKKATLVTMTRVRVALLVTTVAVASSQAYFIHFMEQMGSIAIRSCLVKNEYVDIFDQVKFGMRESSASSCLRA
jgi:hypothetical protein